MSMHVPVGPFAYEIRLFSGPIPHPDGPAMGTCDTAAMLILISDCVPAGKRMSLFWHELAHAIKGECDVTLAPGLDEEAIANLMGLGLARLDARTLARVQVYLQQGIEARDVIMLPGVHDAIPVISPVWA